MDESTRKAIEEIVYLAMGDEAGMYADEHVNKLYNLMDQKIRNELVRDLRSMGSCPICGAPYRERRHY